MNRKEVECVVDSKCELGESPVWLASAGVCTWLDVGMPSTLLEWSPASGAVGRWALPELTSGMTAGRQERLLLLCKSGLYWFDRGSGERRKLAEPPVPMQTLRFNDCGCDASGRLWTGTMADNFAVPDVIAGAELPPAAAGEIIRYDLDLSVHRLVKGIGCPNTFAWSPDDRTLYSADSSTGCLYAFDFDMQDGTISNRRIFCSPAGLGTPDGSAIDANGHLWNARWGAGCVAHFAPDGTLQETVSIPAQLVTSCTFGGDRLDTLFVTTARYGLTPSERAAYPRAGGLFAFRPGVTGLRGRSCL